MGKAAQDLKDNAKKPLDIAKSANDFNKSEGLPEVKPEKSKVSARATEIANAYDNMKHDPDSPEAKKSYKALIEDTKKQWNYIQDKMGIKIEPTYEDPYKSHEEMMNDVKDNKRLKVWRGGNPLEPGHPLSEVDPKTGEKYNTMFRAVHDLFGHAAQGHDFSEAGEESAWNTHRQMMSPEAIPAMTTETRAQVASLFKNGEKFPEQKAGILPDFAMEKDGAKNHAEEIAKLPTTKAAVLPTTLLREIWEGPTRTLCRCTPSFLAQLTVRRPPQHKSRSTWIFLRLRKLWNPTLN